MWTSSVKINDKIFQKILETLFLAHFSNFGGKINFFGKSGSVTQNSNGFRAPCQNVEKTNDIILSKSPCRWKNRCRDKQTLFYRTLPATTQVQNWNEYHFYWDTYLVRACSLIENFQAFAAVWSYPLSF